MVERSIKATLKRDMNRHKRYRKRFARVAAGMGSRPSKPLALAFAVEQLNGDLFRIMLQQQESYNDALKKLEASGDLSTSKARVKAHDTAMGSKKTASWKIDHISANRKHQLVNVEDLDALVDHVIECSLHYRKTVESTVHAPRKEKDRERNAAERLLLSNFSALNQLDRSRRQDYLVKDHLRLAAYGLHRH